MRPEDTQACVAPKPPTTAECIELIQNQIDYAGQPYEGCTEEEGLVFEACKAKLLEHDQLTRWKSEAMQVMNDLDFQEIGKEIDLDLGDNIAKSILPYIKKAKSKLLAADDDKNDVIRIHKEKIDLLDEYIKLRAVADEMAKALGDFMEIAAIAKPNCGPKLRALIQTAQEKHKALTAYREANKS